VRYCEGLPERGTRPLTAGERARVEHDGRRARLRVGLAAAGLLAPPAVAVLSVAVAVVLAEVPGGQGWATSVGAAGFVVAFLVGIPLSLLSLRDAVRALRLARADLRLGEVVEFGDGPRSIVVLPRSGRALARDGAVAGALRPVHFGEAASVPADRPTYAVPASSLPEGAPPLGWVRRALAPDEREEARAHAAGLLRLPRLLLGLTAFFVAMLAFHLGRAAATDERVPLSGAAWAVGLALGWLAVWRRRGVARRLLEDVEDGWVLRATDGARAGAEVLPASGLLWSEGAAPAAWRLSRGGAGPAARG